MSSNSATETPPAQKITQETTAPATRPTSTPTGSETSSTSPKDGGAQAAGKALNVNARAFVPKLDGAELSKSGSSPNPRGNSTPSSNSSMGGMPPNVGMFPPGMLGMPPSPMFGAPGFPGLNPAMMRPGGMMLPGMMSPSFQMPGTHNHGGSGQSSVNPPTPNMFNAPSSPTQMPNITVGNNALQQSRSSQPPKFACVLLVGISGVGKTSLGRALIQEIQEDKLGWEFFSGGDYLKDSPSKPAPWETTKTVLDALSETLDTYLKQQATNPIRGLLIDKQCRGVEDLYYLTSLLRSKGLLLWGILGMDVPSDEVLAQRMPGGVADAGFKEKIKYHRVVQSRIQEAAKGVNLWRCIDASGTKKEVVKTLRTMVLGCSSQSPTKQFNYVNYVDSHANMVDSYSTYASVMTNLFTHVHAKAGGKTSLSFPGFTQYVPLPASHLDERKNPLKDYVVRRKVDGTKYVLFYDATKLYLIPRHMRCILEMPSEAWLGIHLNGTGKFILDGYLVKLTKERTREKFVVHDALYWAEKGSTFNLLSRATWKERQERLKINLCAEASAFFPKKVEIVVVHQLSEELKRVATLMEPCDYACEGLAFQHLTKREEPVFLWRPLENVTVDFRLGPYSGADGASTAASATTTTPSGTEATPTKSTGKSHHMVVFGLEVFDQKQAKYVQFRSDTVDIPGRKNVVEGSIVSCGLEPTNDSVHWVFLRPRCDIAIAAMKSSVEDLLKNCLITKQGMLDFFGTGPTDPNTAANQQQQGGMGQPQGSGSMMMAPQLGQEQQPPRQGQPGQAQQIQQGLPPQQQGAKGYAPNNQMGRQTFGSALPPPPGPPPPGHQMGVPPQYQQQLPPPPQGQQQQLLDMEMMTDVQKLQKMAGLPVKVQHVPVPGQKNNSTMDQLSNLLGGTVVHGEQKNQQREGSNGNETDHRRSNNTNTNNDQQQRGSGGGRARKCGSCREYVAEGDVDHRNNMWYCFPCWAETGVEFCEECGDFATGGRTEGTRRHPGNFYCDACWVAYEKKSGSKRPERRGGAKTASYNSNRKSTSPGTTDKENAAEEGKKQTRAVTPPVETATATATTPSE